MFRVTAILCAFLAAGAALAGPPLEKGAEVAFLGIHLINTSPLPLRPEEAARAGLLEEAVRARFAEEGLAVMDLSPVAEDLDRVANPANCYGCEVRLARRLGADYVAVGEVQKVSELILSMNLVVRETGEGAMVRGRSVDIRSNTDDSWLRGIRYILNTEIFKE
ncbi:DUF3280 domain-containing protein [Mangrovicoccus sp. HB161399]|uniref:DUF3280 domain-containing protein n=1 Tax=Mangrovicoccus sp. HB161399 TaxID=2720392 RepID=UPI0015581C2D|nr:DUF3280 domain-containing protein [Mangrovicoccus sp. HB161399]